MSESENSQDKIFNLSWLFLQTRVWGCSPHVFMPCTYKGASCSKKFMQITESLILLSVVEGIGGCSVALAIINKTYIPKFFLLGYLCLVRPEG